MNMKTKNIKKVVKTALCLTLPLGTLCGSALLTSCNDFLTITPTSSIVEEDFWKDKNDLYNAVMGCYKTAVGNGMLEKYVQWGEMRSDNFEFSTAVSTTSPVANIMNANLLPTYGQFDWVGAYQVINYCNKVLTHGENVVETDEAFSNSDWKPIRAEIIALRAFTHFNLVRTFGEIPYVTEDFNNDSQDLRTPQSTQLQVLDNIINDLESVLDEAMVDYSNTIENKGRFTKKSICTLLADVYLWRASYLAGNNKPFSRLDYYDIFDGEKVGIRTDKPTSTAQGDYQKCVEYCDKVIEMTKEEKLKRLKKNGTIVGGADIKLYLEDLLEQNEVGQTTTVSELPVRVSSEPYAYDRIFGIGNSDESIFELQVNGSINYINSMVTNLFYNVDDSKPGTFVGSLSLFEGIMENPNVEAPDKVYTKTDYRRWESLQYAGVGQTSFYINKYVAVAVSQQAGNTSTMLQDNTATNLKVSLSVTGNAYNSSNWIVYRMPDIFLMKAEAMSQLYTDEENLEEAFKYVREVFKRSNPWAYEKNNTKAATDSLKFANFNTAANLEKLVMAERQREFIGEGKRWYDLVRYAQRHGGTAEMLDLLCRKYGSNSKAVRAKLATMQSLFSPVYHNDLLSNTKLYQNGVWFINESSSR